MENIEQILYKMRPTDPQMREAARKIVEDTIAAKRLHAAMAAEGVDVPEAWLRDHLIAAHGRQMLAESISELGERMIEAIALASRGP